MTIRHFSQLDTSRALERLRVVGFLGIRPISPERNGRNGIPRNHRNGIGTAVTQPLLVRAGVTVKNRHLSPCRSQTCQDWSVVGRRSRVKQASERPRSAVGIVTREVRYCHAKTADRATPRASTGIGTRASPDRNGTERNGSKRIGTERNLGLPASSWLRV